jgi:hypothetical protein
MGSPPYSHFKIQSFLLALCLAFEVAFQTLAGRRTLLSFSLNEDPSTEPSHAAVFAQRWKERGLTRADNAAAEGSHASCR